MFFFSFYKIERLGQKERVGRRENERMETKEKQENLKIKEDAPMSFDELLEDKEYQKEFDRRVSKALETAEKTWQEKAEARKAEAERLAKMDEDQKKSYEYEKVSKERDSAVSELNAYRLKDESIKQAREKGVDLSLMDTLDYTKETAESISKKIEIFSNASKKIYESAINEYSKEPTPQVGDTITSKTLGECKTYEEIQKYYEEHPDA